MKHDEWFLHQVDSRVLCVTEWAKPPGKHALTQLARLYRALVWEGFILLAVAAKEDKSSEQKPGETTETLSRSGSSGGMETSVAMEGVKELGLKIKAPQSSADVGPSSQSQAAAVRTAIVPPSTSLPTDVAMDQSSCSDSEEAGGMARVRSLDPAVKASGFGIAPANILIQSLKQLTPLLTITSRVGRSLAEFLNLLVKVSTSPMHRPHRRGAGFVIPHYQPPRDVAISVCSEVTNLLLDSLKWEVPMPKSCLPAMQSPIRDWLFGG